MLKILEEEIRLDDEENGLIASGADQDGFFIKEVIGKGKIYVYYSEINSLEQLIRKVKHQYKNRYSQYSPDSQGKKDIKKGLYKTFGDVRKFGEYNRYIHSDDWKQKREERIKLDNGKCKNCGSKVGLQVHHKNYSSLGNEDVKSDLATLCDDCHNKITKLNRKKRRGVVTDFS